MEEKHKPKVGLYIDGANLFYQGKRSGFMIDYKKLYNWVAQESDIVVAKYFIGQPSWEIRLSWHILLDDIRGNIQRS